MLRDLLWGGKWGFWFAVFFSSIALIMAALSGGEIVERQGISLPASIVVYFVSGLIGGAILGLLRPLTKWRIGAALVGIVAMVPASLVLGLFLFGPIHAWNEDMTLTISLLPVLLGGPGGYMYWEPHENSRR